MRRLVITGALGHLGSRLMRTVPPGAWDEVLLVDDLSTQRYASLFDLPAGVPYRFVEADVTRADLTGLLAGAAAVVHLAAMTHAEASLARQEEVERINLDGTLRVAEACQATSARLLFPSTTSVYAPPTPTVDEGCPPEHLLPQSPYAVSKLRAERALEELAGRGLRHVTLRLGTIYGASPGMRFHTAVNRFVWQAVNGLPLTVWRTALHQRRPYLELGDAVRAMMFVIDGDHFDGRVHNVLTDDATVADIVAAIRAEVPGAAVTTVDSPIMNSLSYTVLTDRFRGLGFRFEGRLSAGIRETVALLRGLVGARGGPARSV